MKDNALRRPRRGPRGICGLGMAWQCGVGRGRARARAGQGRAANERGGGQIALSAAQLARRS